jgi:HK97 family phage portal protein
MRVFGFDITRTKAPPPAHLTPVGGGWLPVVREPFTGAWQSNLDQSRQTVLTYHAVYACVTLIAADVSKCRLRLVEEDFDGIWEETDSPAFSPVLRKPNRYQNRIKFFEQWIVSKLLHGNTYILKERDARQVVIGLYVLDPTKVKPLIAPDGAIYYGLNADNLSGIEEQIAVPAREIIHDVMVPLYHPLCGVSPLTASGLAAAQGLAIQKNSGSFFAHGSQPGGVLTAPGPIDDATADRLKKHWEDKFSGENIGKVAVLGDGLKFEQMAVKAVDAQMIEQLKWSAETVCSTFHVPAYMVGVGPPPSYNNINALHQQYYSQCLQSLFECIELCLDEGLGLIEVADHSYGTEFDLDSLLRMDTASLIDSEVKAIHGIKTPNEARKRLNLKPVKGGDTPYLQEQNYSLAALDKRDSQEDPFASKAPPPPAAAPGAADDGEEVAADDVAATAQLAAWSLRSQLDKRAA